MVSFTDCHVSQICRPEDNENLQNSVYNGMNRVHALKFTATGGPDGILQNLGVVAGRRHDRIGLRNSRINTKLENAQNNRGVPALQQGITYVDKGFVNLSHVRAAFHGVNVLVWQMVENIKMKRPRGVGIEMPFCKILQNSKIVGWWRGRKIQLNSVAKVFYLAVIFCNVHTCTYGSEVSEYFDSFDPIQLKSLKKIAFVFLLLSPWTVERVVGSFHRSHHSNYFVDELPCDLHDAA